MAGAGQTLVQRTDHVVHQIHNGEQILLVDGIALGDHLIALIIIDGAGKDIHLAGAGLIMIWGNGGKPTDSAFSGVSPTGGQE